MSVIIKSVIKKSIADKKRLKQGDELISVNNNEINDFLDYDFYIRDEKLKLEVKNSKNKIKIINIKKFQDDDLGLEFETYLMDKHKSCKNKCIFCFIDQLPKGMRESLYFKDDDSRLSFLFGNYITLTNLTEKEIDRIIKMKISPVNISVHTTDDLLRVKMMNNKNAGNVLEIIKKFSYNGIKMNCQLVLCPGINDGEYLKKSIEDLMKFYPNIESIACVPVGRTKFRQNLFELSAYEKETAGAVIDIIEFYAKKSYELNNCHLIYASDEFYLKAERQLPRKERYDEFKQIENGIGMCTSLEEEFLSALKKAKDDDYIKNSINFEESSIATGVGAYSLINSLITSAKAIIPAVNCSVYQIKNDFFGEEITVAGLIVAKDLINQLKGKQLGQKLLITSDMLESTNTKFLDDITVQEVEKELNVKIIPVSNDGYELLDVLTDNY